jgi:nucleotide-binding universal stress UspA family protein
MYQRILVPIDGSATAWRGLDEAIRLAKLTGATLQLLHAVDDLSVATGYETYAVYAGDVIPLLREAGTKLLDEAKARVEAAGVKVETVLLEVFAVRVSDLVVDRAQSWPADLIVIGTHGRRGIGRLLLGSDAEQIVRMSPVPVLLIRAPEVDAAAQTAGEAGAAARPANEPVSA